MEKMKYSKFYIDPIHYLENFSIEKDSTFEYLKKEVDRQVNNLKSDLKKEKADCHVNNFKSDLKKGKVDFKNFVDNFENMDRQEFFKNYVKFYRVNYDNLLNAYINKYIGKNTKTIEIKTDDLRVEESDFEDYDILGRFFTKGFYGLHYKVVCDKSSKIKSFKTEDKVYSKKEIKELCDANKIFVLKTTEDNYMDDSSNLGYDHYSVNEIAPKDGEQKVKESNAIHIKVGCRLHKELGDFNYLQEHANKEYFDEFCVENARFIDLIRSEFTKEALTKDYESYCAKYQEFKNEIIKNILESIKVVKSTTKELDEMLEDVKSE